MNSKIYERVIINDVYNKKIEVQTICTSYEPTFTHMSRKCVRTYLQPSDITVCAKP